MLSAFIFYTKKYRYETFFFILSSLNKIYFNCFTVKYITIYVSPDTSLNFEEKEGNT